MALNRKHSFSGWHMAMSVGLLLAAILFTAALPAAAANGCSDCHQEETAAPFSHPPGDEGCADCHTLSSNHPDDGQPARTAEEPALCFQCHEPFAGATVHRPVAEGACSDCHDPHGSDYPKLLPVGRHQQDLCFGCHDEGLVANRHGHGPAATGECTFCHDPHAADQPKLLRKPVQDLCIACHTELAKGIASAKFVHTAIREQQCVACHQPHGSDYPFILKADQQRVCFTCHEEWGTLYGSARSKHKPLYTEKGCGTCHFTHYSDKAALLREEQPQLCFTCHGGEQDPAAPRPLRNIAQEIEGKKYLHAPLADDGCTACHNPHGSRYPRLLTEAYPETFYAPYNSRGYAFCFQCHDAALVESERTDEATGFRNGTTNLHFLHVHKVKKGRTCRACHEPHASNAPMLITSRGARFGEWRIPIRFQQEEHGGRCAPGCHRELRYDRNQPVIYKGEGTP